MSSPTAVSAPLAPREKRRRAPRELEIMLFKETSELIVRSLPYKQDGFAEGDATEYNRQFIEVLDELRLEVQEKGIDLRESKGDYLARLRDLGEQAYAQFFPDEAQKAIGREDGREYRQRGLRLTLKVPPTLSLLWELLYAGDDPLNAALDPECFWGFRYLLGRTYIGIEDPPDYIPLRAGAFSASHAGLKFPEKEVEALEGYLRDLCQRLGLKVSVGQLEESLAVGAVTTDGFISLLTSNDFRYGIIHFACHCENDPAKGANQAYLRLTAHGTELAVALGKLQAVRAKYRLMHRPFVFLNACDSGTPGHLLQMLTFPTGMLRFGAGGVIATACTMPDEFASEFARHFYHELLRGPHDRGPPEVYIGEALLATRRHFLKKYENPLGLAYGLYAHANPELLLED
jgi:hypothetical protein